MIVQNITNVIANAADKTRVKKPVIKLILKVIDHKNTIKINDKISWKISGNLQIKQTIKIEQ